MRYQIVCTKCGKLAKESSFRCHKCGSILKVAYNYSKVRISKRWGRGKGISRYSALLPVNGKMISLGEGGTALLSRPGIFPGVRLMLKMETKNPTNSFKDRGSAVEITKALELNFKEVCCASTGNMGFSVSRYCRKNGIHATIFLSNDANRTKVNDIKKEGASLVRVNGDFNEALKQAEEFAKRTGAMVCGDYHFRQEGQKTVAYEIAEQLKYKMPDMIFLPVGNGTLFSAVYKGFLELQNESLIDSIPMLMAVQSTGCDPVIRAWKRDGKIKYVTPRTKADAIAVGYPTFGYETLDAINGSGGKAVSVSESDTHKAFSKLARLSLYAELGGAVGFAGLEKLYAKSKGSLKGKRIVVIVSGNNETHLRRSGSR